MYRARVCGFVCIVLGAGCWVACAQDIACAALCVSCLVLGAGSRVMGAQDTADSQDRAAQQDELQAINTGVPTTEECTLLSLSSPRADAEDATVTLGGTIDVAADTSSSLVPQM